MNARDHAGLFHDLSVPGGRPLCGADAVPGGQPREAPRVTCPACARLVADDHRWSTHLMRPRSDESED